MVKKLFKNICPPGIICVTPNVVFLLLVILILIFVLLHYKQVHTVIVTKEQQQQKQPQQQPQQQQQQIHTNINLKTDDRYTMAPDPTYINVGTRGLAGVYQQLGIVKTSAGLYPLYGRRINSSSDFYNYYTRTDTYNPLPLPIEYNKRDCQDTNGCYELYTGDKVSIVPTNESGVVTIYRSKSLTYIPNVL